MVAKVFILRCDEDLTFWGRLWDAFLLLAILNCALHTGKKRPCTCHTNGWSLRAISKYMAKDECSKFPMTLWMRLKFGKQCIFCFECNVYKKIDCISLSCASFTTHQFNLVCYWRVIHGLKSNKILLPKLIHNVNAWQISVAAKSNLSIRKH